MTAEMTGSTHARAQVFGDFASWVSRPQRDLAVVAKTAATLAGRQGIAAGEMQLILQRVYAESVGPFLQSWWPSGLERQRRYEQLREALSATRLI